MVRHNSKKKKAETVFRMHTKPKVHTLVVRLWTFPNMVLHYDFFIEELNSTVYVSAPYYLLQDVITAGIDKLQEYGQVQFPSHV